MHLEDKQQDPAQKLLGTLASIIELQPVLGLVLGTLCSGLLLLLKDSWDLSMLLFPLIPFIALSLGSLGLYAYFRKKLPFGFFLRGKRKFVFIPAALLFIGFQLLGFLK